MGANDLRLRHASEERENLYCHGRQTRIRGGIEHRATATRECHPTRPGPKLSGYLPAEPRRCTCDQHPRVVAKNRHHVLLGRTRTRVVVMELYS